MVGVRSFLAIPIVLEVLFLNLALALSQATNQNVSTFGNECISDNGVDTQLFLLVLGLIALLAVSQFSLLRQILTLDYNCGRCLLLIESSGLLYQNLFRSSLDVLVVGSMSYQIAKYLLQIKHLK